MKTSTKSTHTPGPWQIATYETFFSVVRGETKIARQVDNEANARLMAAAPELLEAIKRYKTWADRPDSEKVLAVIEAERELVERELNEAIAKAEAL